MALWPGDALHAPWWIAKMAQLLGKIDSLIEASQYDPDKLLAPYEYWPSNRSAELKDWLDNRQQVAEDRRKPSVPEI